MFKLLKYEFRKALSAFLALLGITVALEVYFLIALNAKNENHLVLSTILLAFSAFAAAIFVFVRGITSYSGGALAQLCDVSLVAISKEATQIHGLPVSSRLTHLLLMDTLCAYINAKQKDTMLEKRSISNEIMDRHYQHY